MLNSVLRERALTVSYLNHIIGGAWNKNIPIVAGNSNDYVYYLSTKYFTRTERDSTSTYAVAGTVHFSTLLKKGNMLMGQPSIESSWLEHLI